MYHGIWAVLQIRAPFLGPFYKAAVLSLGLKRNPSPENYVGIWLHCLSQYLRKQVDGGQQAWV